MLRYMLISDAIRYAGSQAALGKLLGVTRQAVCQWRGPELPELYQYRLRKLKPRWFSRAAKEAAERVAA